MKNRMITTALAVLVTALPLCAHGQDWNQYWDQDRNHGWSQNTNQAWSHHSPKAKRYGTRHRNVRTITAYEARHAAMSIYRHEVPVGRPQLVKIDGRWVYRVNMRRNGNVHTVYIDAHSGRAVQV